MGLTRKKHRGGDPDKCIFIELGYNNSGLGNQLFVYAAGVVAKMKTGNKLCMVWSDENPHSSTDYRPMLLQGESAEKTDSRIKSATSLHENLDMFNSWSDKNIPSNSDNYLMEGSLYHTYKPIIKAIPIIRADFKMVFAKMFPGFSISPESAFVHVRRGDYTKVYSNKLPSLKYYKAGIELLRKAGVEYVYLISNDLEWCKEHFKGLHLTLFGGDELQTLYLMSMCKAGAVISPSTYGAWGAILGPDENKKSTIVYPKNWLGRKNNPHKWPSRWTAI